jgi:phytoene dehydrogenase-like protein
MTEQHEVAGGYCHSFTREGYRFSSGVHCLGELGPGGQFRALYEGLGVSGDLEFCELNPEGYDHIVIGGERFDIPKDVEVYIDRLINRFPHESVGIQKYFKIVIELVAAALASMDKESSVSRSQALRNMALQVRWGFSTAGNLIDHYISDPLLKAILVGQSGEHGLPPSQVPALMHSFIVQTFLNGSYYPRGGGFALPRAFVRALKRAGGELRCSTLVERILLERKRVIGVRLAGGEEIRANYVVSNADPGVTFGKLIGRENLSGKTRRKLDRTKYATSNLGLFMAVDMDLRAAGMDSGNFWFYDHADLDQIYIQSLGDHILHAETPSVMFVTAPTLKDPSKMHSGHHTMEVLVFTSFEPFARWTDKEKREQDPEYQELKGRLENKILTGLERHLPGLRDNVVFSELSTPVTNLHFVNATQGNMYGIAKIRSQFGPFSYPLKTEFEGLYCCGASTINHGVQSVTFSGVMAASMILDCQISDLLQQGGPELRVYPSEKPEEWPEELQARIVRGKERKVVKAE